MDPVLVKRATERMMQARIDVMLTDVFFGALLARLSMEAHDDVDYMATDGKRIRFNPARVADAPMQEIRSVIKHEVLHCALGHVWRRDDRDREIFNQAADHVANLLLKQAGNWVGPDWLCDPRFEGMSVERVYSILRQERADQQRQEQEQQDGQPEEGDDGQPQDGPQDASADDQATPGAPDPQRPAGDGSGKPQGPSEGPGKPDLGPGGMDDPADEGDGTGGDAEAAKWEIAAVQAAMQAAAHGQDPGGFKSALNQARASRSDLAAELRRFVAQVTANDYTWTRPNARYAAGGLYLPALRDESLGPIVIVRDTSGSIGDRVLAQFNGEIASVLDEARPSRIAVLDADTRVANVVEIERGDAMPDALREAFGRGGTDFRAAFDWVEQNMTDEPPAALVYLTDMEGTFPESPPDYPVLWVSIAGVSQAPFGEVIAISDDER